MSRSEKKSIKIRETGKRVTGMDTARTDERKNAAKYEKSQLELMTTYQLREICRHEKIMNGVIHPLDKEELIQTIMRYMGKRQDLLIREHQRDGKERVEAFLRKTRITYKTDEKLCCQSKIVAYEGLEIKLMTTTRFHTKRSWQVQSHF